MNTQKFIQALEDTNFTIRSYSGRSMYGKHCIGIDVDNMGEAFKIAGELVANGFSADDIVELGDDMKWDNMGLGFIIYWPRVLKLTEEESAALLEQEYAEEE